ncbi:hypothetical protein O181_043319 [Austropuccinia psidii MF-1]|uniref:Mediator of RNA polymerase II transcription subunit 18 n=1 Tax=Austropuccinia psidii MF-1 TaxID=1389203 RepID=A0A9Q3HIB0_9BASI|nr:hypothetical protein [Austropuccinia psidii MF-1]
MSTEISVCGLIPMDLRQSVFDRLSNHTHSVCHFNLREMVFDRGSLEGPSEDSNILRLRHINQIPKGILDKTNFDGLTRNGWNLTLLGRPEPERLSPDFSIRPYHVCPILDGDPIEFCNALGYRKKFEFFRKGLVFVRGAVVIEVFQIYEGNDETSKPIAWSDSYLITVTVIASTTTATVATSNAKPKVTNPITSDNHKNNNTGSSIKVSGSGSMLQQQELRNQGINRIREVQAILKGLVDLSRVEPF